jgi:hypothetical protein
MYHTVVIVKRNFSESFGQLFLEKRKGRHKCRPFWKINENYFLGAMASFAAFATRNFTTVFALI